MSPTVRKAIQNSALALVVAGTGTGAFVAWKRFGKLDPYASIEKQNVPSDPSSSIVATGVKIRHYEKGKLVASTSADRMSMSDDRSALTLKGIKDGTVQTPKGQVNFEGGTGILHPNLRMIDVSNGVRIKGSQFDLATSKANIDGRQGQISMPEPLKGKIGNSDVVMKTLVYVANTDFFHATNVAARGNFPRESGLPATMQGRAWDVAAEDLKQEKGLRIYTEARAEDGEVVVMAPKVVEEVKTSILTATGRATYRSAKADIIADKVVVYRREKKAVFTGNVITLIRAKKDWDKPLSKVDNGGKPLVPDPPPGHSGTGQETISPVDKQRDEELRSGKTLRDYPMNLKAEEVTYWYGEGSRHAIAKGGDPTAFQQFDKGRWRETKAFEAHYDGEKDLLDLLSDGPKIQVKYKNSIGDWGTANTMQMSTKEDVPEDDSDVHGTKPNMHYVDRDPDNDPRGATKPADPKKPVTTPPPGTNPPVKTPPVKAGP